MTHPRRVIAATFLMAASVLATEIILTRVFSVLMWYHFAFLAICVCLFGMGVGSLALHLFGRNLRDDDLPVHMAWSALGFVISQVICVMLLRIMKLGSLDVNLVSLLQMGIVFLVCAVPFGFAGLFLGLVFSRGSKNIGNIYFADLTGAALGCIITIWILGVFGGAASLLAVAILAAVAGLVACPGYFGKDKTLSLVGGIVGLALLLVIDHFTGFLVFHHSKGNEEPDPIAVAWNSFSRVIAFERPKLGDVMMEIDGVAHAPITPFHGDIEATQVESAKLQRLPFEYLDKPKVLIVGSGGGEHILTALAAGAREVVGIEMNPIVIDWVDKKFDDMAGGLFRWPGVKVELAEGRSFIARSKEKYDTINFTLIDTWAATAAGAFSLTENFLFTEQAFNEYFDHLTPQGFLSIKRWQEPEEYPMRLAVLGRKVLEDRGVEDPEECIFIAANDAFANIIIATREFGTQDVVRLKKLTEQLNLKILYSPKLSGPENIFRKLLTGETSKVLADSPYDLSPPTDDHPFFFYTLRTGDLPKTFAMAWGSKIRNLGTLILFSLAGIVTVCVIVLLIGPLVLVRQHRLLLKGNLRAGLYFALIGVGFLTVEVSMMQSFILFLGHPTLTLAVFLATLLFTGGLGAAISGRLGKEYPRRTLMMLIFGLIAYALFLRAVQEPIFSSALGLSTAVRCGITVLILAPLGILMGMPFPFGVRAVSEDGTVPWMFAINSAASVLGSILAMVIALSFGFTFTQFVGLATYFLALVLYPSEDV